MIQRIQTIWLMLASACAFASLKFSFYSGHKINDPQKLFISLSGTSSTIPITIISVGVALAALALIFFYKDRRIQLRLTLLTLVLSVLVIVLYFMEKQHFVSTESSFDLTAVFVFTIPIFLILGCRGILSDQKLIKNADRLR